MTTLKDISAELGLSVATVSRALNGFPEVNARTREQVQAAARRLNYRPNRQAQSLQSGRTGMVGMIVAPDPESPVDRGFVEIMLGLSRELGPQDLDIVFQVQHGQDQLAPYRRLIEKNSVDGFIVNSPAQDDARIAFLQGQSVPFVVHGRDRDDAGYAYFDIDNAGAARDAVVLLGDLGHRRIAFLNGPDGAAFARARAKGFAEAMAAAGNAGGGAAHADDRAVDFGYRQGLALLSGRLGTRPTAILCATTVQAAGLYRAAADLGLAIPRDLSVIAHDDALSDLPAAGFAPPLTVTRAPLRDACAPLARILIAALSGDPATPLQQTERAILIPRQSTGPAPAAGPAAMPAIGSAAPGTSI